MKSYYNTKTKKRITQEEYEKLPDDEKKLCREWREKPPSEDKLGKNDPDWYVVSDAIAKAVANIPFNRFPGNRESLGAKFSGGDLSPISGADVTPGIIALDYIPTAGQSDSPHSALNIAMRAIYTFVRHQNSGRTNYEGPDLMLYLIAMDQIYTAFAELQRVYEIAMTYTYENRYIPLALASACRVNLDDVQNNLANFRYQINLRAAKISSMLVPKKFNIYKRHQLLARNVFTDSDSLRGQFYVFSPTGFLKFDPVGVSTGGSLVFTPRTAGLRTATQLMSDLDALLNAVLQDEDMNIMSGDILKAYGRENCYSIAEVEEQATVNFVFEENVLQQIENLLPFFYTKNETTGAAYRISQVISSSTEDTYLVTSDTKTLADIYLQRFYLNSHKKDPDYKDVLEYTRCSNGISYATELFDVDCVTIYTATFDSFGAFQGYTGRNLPLLLVNGDNSSGLLTQEQEMALAELSSFDWHPCVYLFSGGESGPGTYLGKVMDLKVCTLLDVEDLKEINDNCIMGTLNSLDFKAN